MGNPIRFRRTLHDVPLDVPSVGEPFVHLLDNKFGIYNGANMLWYPCIDPLNKTMLMNLNQRLSGYDENGLSTVMISFDTPNAITFVDSTGSILAQFDSTGASFNNFSAEDPLGGGSLNRFIHPGFIPSMFSQTNLTCVVGEKKWLGPNTLMFLTAAATGEFTAKQTYMAGSGRFTNVTAETLTLQVNVTTTLSGGGIRMWVLDPGTGYFNDANKNHNRFYISVKGELGKTAYLRVGRDNTYSYKQITGVGDWTREFIDIPQHQFLSDFTQQTGNNAPYAVDALYNAQAGIWGLNEPTMQCIDNFSDEIYQYRSLAERMAAANMVWYEPVGFKMFGQQREYVNLPVTMSAYNEGYYFYSVETVFSNYDPVIDEKTKRGFEVHTLEATEAYWKYQPRIMVHGQISDIA